MLRGLKGGDGFTLVEILIVVIILAILAAIVIPNLADIPSIVRETNLKENLSKVRAHIQVYRNVHAGLPDGDRFVEQMTQPTSFEGEVAEARDADHIYGPYLEQMPANPITGSRIVRTSNDPEQLFPPGDQDGGWWYNEANGRFYADLRDEHADDDGLAYNRY
jgi:general secretion pathway protein G